MLRLKYLITACVLTLTVASQAQAITVDFSSADATYYQTFGPRDPSQMIDGIFSGVNGWAIYNDTTRSTAGQTALLTIANPLAAGQYILTFTIYQNYTDYHTLGDFSLNYTTAASPTLSSLQTPVTINSASSIYDSGTTFSLLSPGQLLVGGDDPDAATYVILASISSALPITGIFLDAIKDPTNALPDGGPGRHTGFSSGNFTVTEFTLDAQAQTPLAAVPEPSTWAMMLIGFAGTGLLGWRRKRKCVAIA